MIYNTKYWNIYNWLTPTIFNSSQWARKTEWLRLRADNKSQQIIKPTFNQSTQRKTIACLTASTLKSASPSGISKKTLPRYSAKFAFCQDSTPSLCCCSSGSKFYTRLLIAPHFIRIQFPKLQVIGSARLLNADKSICRSAACKGFC